LGGVFFSSHSLKDLEGQVVDQQQQMAGIFWTKVVQVEEEFKQKQEKSRAGDPPFLVVIVA